MMQTNLTQCDARFFIKTTMEKSGLTPENKRTMVSARHVIEAVFDNFELNTGYTEYFKSRVLLAATNPNGERGEQ